MHEMIAHEEKNPFIETEKVLLDLYTQKIKILGMRCSPVLYETAVIQSSFANFWWIEI